MIELQELLEAFDRNGHIIQAQTEGLSHDDCLLQPPFRGNCMNWVLGHIAGTRSSLLVALGEEPILTEAESVRYGYGSEPVCVGGEDVIPLQRLLGMLQHSQEQGHIFLARRITHQPDAPYLPS